MTTGTPPETQTSAERRDRLSAVASTHPQELADVVATLSWSVSSPDDLLEHLQRAVDLAVRVVPGTASAGVTAELGRRPTTTAHSGAVTLRVDDHQYAARAGPCLHALATGEVVSADTTTSRGRWPQFAAAAHADGIVSFLAAPLTVRGDTPLGVLNLYGTDPAGFDAAALDLTLVITDHVARDVDDLARLATAQDLADGLATALSRRAVIEQAKGIIMAARQVDAAVAFDVLRAESSTTNRKLHTVCTEFVARWAG